MVSRKGRVDSLRTNNLRKGGGGTEGRKVRSEENGGEEHDNSCNLRGTKLWRGGGGKPIVKDRIGGGRRGGLQKQENTHFRKSPN